MTNDRNFGVRHRDYAAETARYLRGTAAGRVKSRRRRGAELLLEMAGTLVMGGMLAITLALLSGMWF